MKKRTFTIHVELREDTKLNWNSEEDCLEFLNSDGVVSDKNLISVGETYQRTGKHPKTVRQVRNRDGGKVFFGAKAVNIDRFLAIDTSFIPFGNNFICATGCLIINQELGDKPLLKGTFLRISMPPRLIFLARKNEKPERYGWKRLIEAFLKSDFHNPELRYGVVVDSDLNGLGKIEIAEQTILDEFTLPKNFSLIYASADTGNEHIANKLIRLTDRVARDSLEIAVHKHPKYRNFTLQKGFWDIEIQTEKLSRPGWRNVSELT